MTRSIEAVVAEAQRRLEATGRLDVAAFTAAYPEHAAELAEVLPLMLRLHQERRWRRAEEESRAFALGLFAQLAETSAPEVGTATAATQATGNTAQTATGTAVREAAETGPATLGELLRRDREEAGLTLEEQARRFGLSTQALEQLSCDRTPLNQLDNTAIKQLAARVAAPFAVLVKEIRRLIALESLTLGQPGTVFTRDKELSTLEEQEALREQVKRKARRPPEGL